MKMKKLTAVMMTSAMVVGLAACGGNSNTTASTGSAAPAPTTSAATSEAGADEGYKLVKEGTLTMATNAYFPPYEYYDGQDIIGIDADIAKAIADKMGLELKIEDMEFDSIITAVSTGKADLGLAGMTVTPDRQKNVDFSDTYAVIIDNEPAKSYVEANKGLKILDTEFLNEDYAACISKDNAGLTKAVNKALAELKADGTLQKIVDKYIKA